MNGLFHAAAGVAVGAVVLGGEAGRADLALCAVAGTSPDWDAALLAISRPLYKRFHRSLTHGFAGLLAGAALAGAALALAAGWDFRRAAYLWLIAAAAHSAADLFNRSGVALLAPFSMERVGFPAVSWADRPLTLGALLIAALALWRPEAGRAVSLAGLAGYVCYIAWRLREPKLSDPLSRRWFRMVNGEPPGEGPASPPAGAEELGARR